MQPPKQRGLFQARAVISQADACCDIRAKTNTIPTAAIRHTFRRVFHFLELHAACLETESSRLQSNAFRVSASDVAKAGWCGCVRGKTRTRIGVHTGGGRSALHVALHEPQQHRSKRTHHLNAQPQNTFLLTTCTRTRPRLLDKVTSMYRHKRARENAQSPRECIPRYLSERFLRVQLIGTGRKHVDSQLGPGW